MRPQIAMPLLTTPVCPLATRTPTAWTLRSLLCAVLDDCEQASGCGSLLRTVRPDDSSPSHGWLVHCRLLVEAGVRASLGWRGEPLLPSSPLLDGGKRREVRTPLHTEHSSRQRTTSVTRGECERKRKRKFRNARGGWVGERERERRERFLRQWSSDVDLDSMFINRTTSMRILETS